MNYTAKKIGPIGDNDPKYGQKYWGTVEEAQMEVSFNLMNPVDISEGAKLDFEEKMIRETKGSEEKPPREYMFLKKVKVSGAGPQTSIPTSSGPSRLPKMTYDLVKQNNELLKKLVGEESEQPEDSKKEEKVAELDDEPINLDDIPF
jgi:hypothetical protein